MELYDESELQKSKKNKKISNIILILIILIFFIILGLIVVIMSLQTEKLLLTLDGKTNNDLMSILKFEDNNKIYIPIKKVANYLGYDSYNGNYSQPSEDTSKCYIQSENEITNFSLNSDIIYKIKPNSSTNSYESVQIDEPIKAIDGELYTTIDGIQKAFNVSFEYKNNKITIYTIDYLISQYANIVINYGYTEINGSFENKKTILDDMLVVNKEQKCGVINVDGTIVLDTKYDNITYMQQTSDFLVQSNNKMGIISKNKQTKVSVSYDSIENMNNDSDLYVVKQNEKYGVIDINGNIKIYPEYSKIGVDINLFQYNDIKNGYILLDSLIPVQKENKWGLFDKAGNKIVDFVYDDLGYVRNDSRNTNNLLVVPGYDVLVVKKEDKYNLISLKGQEIFNVFVDAIYTSTESGENKYYMIYNGQARDLLPYLKSYITKSNNQTTEIENTKTNEISNTTNNTNITQ